MPPQVFLPLLATVLLAAGGTVAVFQASGASLAALGLIALLAGLALRLWGRR